MSKRRIDRVTLASLLEVDEGFVTELLAHEIVVTDGEGLFDHVAVERVRLSWSMQRNLGVNLAGLEVALDLLERWEAERKKVRRLLDVIEELRRDRD